MSAPFSPPGPPLVVAMLSCHGVATARLGSPSFLGLNPEPKCQLHSIGTCDYAPAFQGGGGGDDLRVKCRAGFWHWSGAMGSRERQARGGGAALAPARVSFSKVKLQPNEPRRGPGLPEQSPFGRFLSAAEGSFRAFCGRWSPVTARARDALLAHAAKRRMPVLNSAPMLRLAALSLSNEQGGESARASRRKAPGLQEGAQEEERVLISEILIQDRDGQQLADPELTSTAWEALKACKPNFALTTSEVQADVHRIIDTGFFASCMPSAEDTRDGVRLIFKVEPNQELKGLIFNGANVLPTRVVHDAFRGKVVNIQRLNTVLDTLNGWYRDRGLFGQVTDVEILQDGVIKVQVAEAEVHNINIRFLDRKTGEPTVGKTRPETLLRQLTTRKGQVYSLQQGRRDVETVFTMGIMEDVNLVPQPAGDTGMVDLTMNVVERVTGGFSAGGGLSGNGISNGALSGLVGSFAYSHRNAFGRNQKLNVSLERGQVDSMFRINYTDPWIEGDDKRTSRAINIQNSRAPGTTVHGIRKDALSTGPLHGGVTIGRLMAGVDYSRPLRPKWSGTAGISFQRAGARDEHGSVEVVDMYGGPLTFSGRAFDDMLVTKLETVYTDSGDNSSSQLVFNTEQALPVAPDWLFFNRINVRARQGLRLGPVRCIASFSGGTVVGDLAPHEAFPIGGTNSVRGYDEGAVGSGRSCVVASGEISIPLAGPVEGAIFADYGSDLGSGSTVLGDPAGVRGKPGHGYGYGAGLRVDSPLGPLRLEYAFNDSKARRFHFGIGYRN